jgi:outer membrane protein assembly factor BamD
MAAYAYYSDDYYYEAINQIEDYIKKYPNDIYMDYAHFILAMCYYENIVDEKRDLQPLLKSKKKFEFIITEYPNTDFALDAKFKLELIKERLAGKEMFIARHYLKTKKWIPAINRFKIILKNYETTVYVEEALYRLVEINYKLGLINESKKYANLLGYNYDSSEWYKASYKIFNKDYVYDDKKAKRLKQKNKKKILSKFKAKFKTIFE